MAIQYVGGVKSGRAGSTGTGSQSLSGTLTGGLASSPAEGDLVIILIAVGSASGYAPTTLAVSGWTNGTFRSNTGATNYSYQQYSYKFMTSTPDTSITIPSTGNIRNAQSWAVHVFRNVDSTNPLDTTTIFTSGTATGRPNPNSITPTTAGAWILWAGASCAATGATYTAPTDFSTNWLTQTDIDTYDSMLGFGYYTGWTSGAYDPAAITAGGTTGAQVIRGLQKPWRCGLEHLIPIEPHWSARCDSLGRRLRWGSRTVERHQLQRCGWTDSNRRLRRHGLEVH